MSTMTSNESVKQLLQSIQPSIDDDSEYEPLAERREFQRIPFRGRAKAIIFPSPTCPASATVHDSEVVTSDLSRGGISILCRLQLAEGQQLMLMLNDRPQLVEVRWCCQVWNSLFAAGCRFLSEPASIDVEQQLTAIDIVISNEDLWWDAGEPSKAP